MRLRPLIGAGLAAAALLGGCGVPGSSGVHDDGPGLSGRLGGLGVGEQPPNRLATKDPNQFVLNFLKAPAGDFDGAEKRQSQFMTQRAQLDWRPAKGINVIALTEEPLVTTGATGSEVELKHVQHIGVLDDQGILEPPPPQQADKYTFHVGAEQDENSGLYVSGPPPVILMTLDALDNYYDVRPLYFWDTDHSGLVPDARYLAASVTPAQRPDQLLEWLIKGPSPWLDAAVESLPDGTQAPGNVPDPSSAGVVVVNLNAAALTGEEDQLDRLGAQLRWSLRPDWKGDLELTIDNQHKKTFRGDAYLAANPAAVRYAAAPPWFCVFQGGVHRLSPSDQTADVPIDAKYNRNVRFAALTRAVTGDRILGALVKSTNGGEELWVGDSARGYKRIGAATDMSRPAWLVGSGGAGLVAADGKLYRFSRDDLSELELTGSDGKVTAVATPVDGRRVAYVAGGRLYVAALVRDHEKLTRVDTAQQVRTPFSRVTAVAWSGEDRLVVAGARSNNGRTALFEMNADGGQRREAVDSLGTAKVDYLVAFPDDPARPGEDRRIMYQAGDASYELFSVSSVPLAVQDVVGVAPTPQKSAGSPSAPFFLE